MDELPKEKTQKNQWKDQFKLTFSNENSTTKDIPNTLATVFALVSRPKLISAILLIAQMVELLAQTLPEKIDSDSKIFPIIHDFLLLFSVKQYSEEVQFVLIVISALINLFSILFLLILIMVPKQKSSKIDVIQKFVTFMTVNVIQVYNFFFLIPFVNLSTLELFKTEEKSGLLISKFISAFTLMTSIINSYFITNWQNKLTFKLQDHLSLFPGVNNLLRWAIILISAIVFCQSSSWNSTLSAVVFLLLLLDYAINLPYCSPFISRLYASLLMIGMLFSFQYSILLHEAIKNQRMDPSLFIGLSFVFSVKLGGRARKLLLSHKIFSKELSVTADALNLDLLAREVSRYISEREQEPELKIQAEILKILISHSNSCQTHSCDCKSIDFSKEFNWNDKKRLVLRCIGSFFLNSFDGHWKPEFELSLLNYCAYILDVEKLPNKAVNLMYKNERRLKSLKSKIIMKIIHNRCRDKRLKKIKKINTKTSDYAEIVIFEREAEDLERRANSFFLGLLEYIIRVNHSFREEGIGLRAKYALSKGWELSEDQVYLKRNLLRLLSKNQENLRLLKIAVKINSIFDEDEEFMTSIKQIELQRLVKIREREKQGVEGSKFQDIFNPNSGVIYLNMSDNIGRVEKVSTSILRLLDSTRAEIEGQSINNYMPEIFAKKHDDILRNFINQNDLPTKRDSYLYLFALDKERHLLNVTINLCVDTFFENSFMVSALMTLNMEEQKYLICNEFGQILNTSKELDAVLGLNAYRERKKCRELNVCVFIPQLFWSFFPEQGKEDVNLFDEPAEVKEMKVLFVFPEVTENSKRPDDLNISAIMQKCSNPNSLDMSPLNLKGRKRKSEWNTSKEGYVIANDVFKKIFSSLENPGGVYIMKIRIKVLRFCQGEIKLAYLNFSDIKKLTDNDLIEYYRNTKLKRFLLFMNRGMTFTLDAKISKGSESFDENEKNEKSHHASENLCEPDETHTPKLKNNIKLYPVKLPNNPSAHSQFLSLRAPQLIVSTKTERIPNAEIREIPPSKKVKSPSLNIPLPEILDKPNKRKSGEIAQNKMGLPNSNMEDSKLTSDVNPSLFEDFFIENKSENSSSLSDGSVLAMVNTLRTFSTKEMKVLYTTKNLLYVFFIILMFFMWSFNTTSMVTVNDNLVGSRFLQDLIIPISFLIKDYVINDYFDKHLAVDPTHKDLSEFIGITKPAIMDTMNDVDVNLSKSPFADGVLFKRKTSLSHPNLDPPFSPISIDLKQTYSILLGFFNNLNGGFQVDGLSIIHREFFLTNYIPFAKDYIYIFDDIVSSIKDQLGGIINISLIVIISVVSSLIIIYAYAFWCALKIKLNSQSLALALTNFDKETINSKLNEIAMHIRDLYPQSNSEVRALLGDVLGESKGDFKKSVNKTTRSANQAKNMERNSVIFIPASNKSVSKQKDKINKRFSIMDVKMFVLFSLLSFSLIFAIPVSTFVINDFLLKEFSAKVDKILVVKEGIQMFMVSFTAMNTLKQIEYQFLIEPETESTIDLRAKIAEHVSWLSQTQKKNSDPLKIVDQEDGFPELTRLNSEFFLGDICQVLKKKSINIDFTEKFNSNLCETALEGSLKRGVKTLSLEINSIVSDWDAKMARGNPKYAFRDIIFDSQAFPDLQYSLYLVKILEEIELEEILVVLEKYLTPFKQQEAFWLGFGLFLILVSFFLVWHLLLLSLKNTYRSSMSMLRNFPSKLILGNKILLARIDQLVNGNGK